MPKILAIDDINDNLISLKAIINDAFPDSIVFSALNGLIGIELAITEKPDVILLDIKMPGMDGFEVCRQIKQDERLCEIPVVFLTAFKSDKVNRIKALEVGADAFLSKPIDSIELTAQIRAMVKIKIANEQKRDEKVRLSRLVTERTQKLELSQISSLNLLNDLKSENEVRRRTEEELKASEQKYRFLVENTADTITLLDLDLNYTYISPSVFKLRGFTVEEAMAQNLQSSTVPESVERAYAMFQKEMALEANGSANPDRIHSIELQQYCKDGSIIWVENSVTFIRDESGKVNGIIVVSKNITERKLAEEKLRESEMRFKIFFEKAADAIFIAEADSGIIVDANKAASRLMKLPHNEIVGIHQSQLHPKENEQYTKITFDKHKNEIKLKNSTHPTENKLLRSDGTLVPVEILATEVLLNGKKCLMGTFRDITERKLAEEALLESEKRYRMLVEKSPAGIAIYQEREFVYVNPAGLTIFGGADQNELIGKPVLSVVHPDSHDEVIKRMMLVNSGHAVPSMEERLIRFDGSIFYAEVVALGTTYNNKPAGQVIVWDITDRKRAEEELNKSFSLLNATLESTADGILVVDKNGVITNFNKKFTELWRIPESMISTRDDAKLISFVISQLKDPESFLTKVKDLYLKIEETSFDILEFKDGRIFERYSQSQQFEGKSVGRVWSFRDITSRRHAEEKYSSIFENSVEGIYQSTPGGRFLIANPAMAAILGFSSPEELVRERSDISKQGYAEPNIREEFKRQLETYGHVIDFEYEAICKDGSKVWVSENARLMHDANIGVYYEGSLVNITRRRKAEESLSKSHELLNKLAGQIPGVVYQYRLYPDGRSSFPYSSPGIMDIYGVTSEEVREDATPVFGRLHPDDYDDFVNSIQHSAHTLQLCHSEFRVILPGRGVCWRLCDAKPERMEDGSTLWYGIISDITDRKQSEQALAHSYDLMNYVIEHDRSSVAVLDKDLKYIYVSQRYRKDFNVGETDIIGKKHYEVFPDLPQKWREVHSRALASEILSAEDEMYIREDGTIDWTSWECRPWYGPDGSVGGIILYTEITTERKKVEAELIAAKEKAIESDRLKSAFLSNMSHEIRTPLNSIIGFSDLMLDPFFKSDQHAEFAGIIKENGNNLLAIISDIMDISKIEAGQVQIKKQLFSLSKLINDLHKEFAFKAIAKGIELRLNPLDAMDEIFVESDEIRLRQVLINLVGNAIKFTEKGFVGIDIKAEVNFVQFQVIDTGIGIPKEFQEQVFERFRQVETANTRKFGGNGLGLAISKSLVELLGGTIWMESEKGKGSIFHFTVPI